MKKDKIIGTVVVLGISAGITIWLGSSNSTPPSDQSSADWLGSQVVADPTPASPQIDLSGLINQLHNANDFQRILAAQKLAALGSQAAPATSDLMDAVKDGVRRPMIYMRSEESALDAIAKIGPGAKDAIPDLINLLIDDGAHEWASNALVAIGNDSIPPLISALDSNAVDAPPPSGGFAPRLDDGSRLILRDEAAQTLGRFGTAAQPAVARLIQMLNSGDLMDEIASARALGDIGQPASDAIPRLRELATTNSPFGLYHAANDSLRQLLGN